MNALDAVIHDLDQRLTGPRNVRKALLNEAREGLEDAAEAYRDAGLPGSEATARAVREFGTPGEPAGDYQTELDACQGRRAALLIAIAYPSLTALWDLLWGLTAAGNGDAPQTITALSRLTDVTSIGAAVLAAIAIPLFGRASPRLVRVLARGVGILGALTVVITVSASIWMSLQNSASGARAVESSAAGLAVVALTVLAALAVARSATVTLLRVGGRTSRRRAALSRR